MTVTTIIDTDIGTDVDDALAVAFAIRHPDINVRAVTTVLGDSQRRGQIAKKLLQVAGRDDIEVAVGLAGGRFQGGRPVEGGHEGEAILEPGETLPVSVRDAVTLLIDECGAAHRTANPITMTTIGIQSNVAAAIARDPGFATTVEQLVVMGGVFAPVHFLSYEVPPWIVDHNLNVDAEASVHALSSGIATTYVPCDVTMNAWLTCDHLETLRSGDALCKLLAALIDVWAPKLRGITGGQLPDECVAILHDPLTVAYLVEPDLVTTEVLPVTVTIHDGWVRTFVDGATGHPATVVTGCDNDRLAELFLTTVMSP